MLSKYVSTTLLITVLSLLTFFPLVQSAPIVSAANPHSIYKVVIIPGPGVPPSNDNSSARPIHHDFQFGPQMADSYKYYGLVERINYFDGQNNPNGFSEWLGVNDNLNYFYQTGITYWGPGSCVTIWAVDNYNGGSLGAGCPPNGTTQFSYHSIDSPYQQIAMWIYQGQWWAEYANGYVATFPNGKDGATYMVGYGGNNGGVSYVEGTTGASYTEGKTTVTYLSFATQVTLSGNTFYLTTANTHSLYFSTSQDAPSTSNFAVDKSSCPYLYSTYWSSSGSLPANRASIATC